MLERVWRKGTLLHCWLECKLIQPLWITVWRFLKKLKIELPAIPLLGIHTKKTRIEGNTFAPIFTAALFTTARTWKPPRCPLADEWIRKLWYIYTMEYCSAIKKDAVKKPKLTTWKGHLEKLQGSRHVCKTLLGSASIAVS